MKYFCIMTKKVVIAGKPFIEAIKAQIAAKKERHAKLLAQIKPTVVEKLQRMQN